jgi:thioredoxin 1
MSTPNSTPNSTPGSTPGSTPEYLPETLSIEEVRAQAGPLLLDFGTGWCGHCAAARAPVEAALRAHGRPVRHVRVEDGPGRQLGRAFGVKLWPTLVFLCDGQEQARLVRPHACSDLVAALRAIDPAHPLSPPA